MNAQPYTLKSPIKGRQNTQKAVFMPVCLKYPNHRNSSDKITDPIYFA